MMKPSTEWREIVGADEHVRHAQLAEQVRHWHARKNAQWGTGRFLHRKPLLSVLATLTVHDNLPPEARHGVFAMPGQREAIVRLSNGALDIQANTKPDIRGFAIRVLGVAGPAALGGEASQQDFLLINHDAFAARDSVEFMEVAAAVAKGGEVGVLWHLLRRYGISEGLGRLRLLARTLGKPFRGYNAERFTTSAPIAIGPYAAKVRIEPKAPRNSIGKDNARDVATQLDAGGLGYEMSLQFYTDEAVTPIEDPRVAWSVDVSPPVPVATLTLHTIADPAAVEAVGFDPWSGLAAHRPLGEVMRARRNAYRVSQQARAR